MKHLVIIIILSLSLFAIGSNATAATYCNGMGSIAELAAKMRDNGLSSKQIIAEFRKMSPSKKVSQDIKDLVESAYIEIGQNQSPKEFRAFFENFCRNNGFDRELH